VARARHARVLPEAVPWFRLLQVGRGAPAPEGVRLPCFVKPVRGAFSRLARPVADARTLTRVVSHASLEQHARCYAEPHRVAARGLGQEAPDPGLLLAEELLHGTQVTVEGWVEGPGEVHALGVVDSIMVPGTHAFARFETPSRLPAGVQERLLHLTRRAVEALGLAWTCFNVEWIHEASTDRLSLLEVNPRLAGQFADLWEKTLGVNGYEVALALALGRPPPRARGGRYAYAASVPLRTFVPLRLERAPTAQAIAALEAEAPDTLIWWEAAPGEPGADCDALGEGQGERLAVINLGAPSRAALLERGEGLGSALLALADWGPGGAGGSAGPESQAPR
jgi:biotin carboxylase